MATDDFLKKIDDLDRNIVKLRALGYKQGDIAKELEISQASVSQRLDTINKLATRSTDDRERLFMTLVVGTTAASFLAYVNRSTE